ncbi:endo-alpha-N-acetylgalactosaminidase family protein [Paenibacillus solisilvae]|uniref:Endo-alpha-N-acetylgalactosaminidase family protein n=1 Tax=Paenibacillus solisilvae TaxID=2486751 RepID=A0ABW0W0J2_9BACL
MAGNDKYRHFVIRNGEWMPDADSFLLHANVADTLVIYESSPKTADGVLEFTIVPQNPHGRLGAVISYVSHDCWVFIGCDTPMDPFGRSTWVWSLPSGMNGVLFKADPLYEGREYRVKIRFIGLIVTIWLDGYQVYYGYLPELKREAGRLAFRAWTYRDEQWAAYRLTKRLRGNGWTVATEEADMLDQQAVWTYDSTGDSRISRFVHHQNKDVYEEDLLLKGGYARSGNNGFMGWQRERDLTAVIESLLTKQLPYRYLMHFAVMKWTDTEVILEGNVQCKQEDGAAKEGDLLFFVVINPILKFFIYSNM